MWISIKSALFSGLLMGVLAIAGYIVGVGDVFQIDPHALVNAGVMAALTTLISLVKSGLTDRNGTIAGVQVK